MFGFPPFPCSRKLFSKVGTRDLAAAVRSGLVATHQPGRCQRDPLADSKHRGPAWKPWRAAEVCGFVVVDWGVVPSDQAELIILTRNNHGLMDICDILDLMRNWSNLGLGVSAPTVLVRAAVRGRELMGQRGQGFSVETSLKREYFVNCGWLCGWPAVYQPRFIRDQEGKFVLQFCIIVVNWALLTSLDPCCDIRIKAESLHSEQWLAGNQQLTTSSWHNDIIMDINLYLQWFSWWYQLCQWNYDWQLDCQP